MPAAAASTGSWKFPPPSSALRILRPTSSPPGASRARLEISLDSDASGEVEVFLPLRRNLVGTSIVTYAPGGEDGYYMLLLAPPPAGSTDALPRDVSLVVDVSGSMSGEKMDQARAALDQALGTLGAA